MKTNVTVSPDTGALVGPVTVTVTVEVAAPLAGKVFGLADTATVLVAVWVTAVAPDWAVAASCAVIVQVPAVVLDV